MKRHIITFFAVALLASTFEVCGQVPAPVSTNKTDFSTIFKNDTDKNSYAAGFYAAATIKNVLNSLSNSDIPVNMEMFMEAIHDNIGTSNSLITEAQDREILNGLSKEMAAKREAKRKIQADKNKAEGAAFLAKNKTAPGVVTLPSGLQYKVLAEGDGPLAKPGDFVDVNYRGKLIDGTEFDSSYKRNRPLPLKVGSGGVIKGWEEVIPLMKRGEKLEVYVPSELGYGEMGHPPAIGPDAVLIFEMEMVSITPPPTPTASTPRPAGTPLTSDIIKVPSAEEMKKGAKIETIKAEDLEKQQAEQSKTNQ